MQTDSATDERELCKPARPSEGHCSLIPARDDEQMLVRSWHAAKQTTKIKVTAWRWEALLATAS